MEYTPFERATRNQIIHTKRAEMTIKIQQMVKKLEECELYLATAKMMEDDDQLSEMFTSELVDTVEKEVESITSALIIIADTWEEVAGVTA